MGAGAEPRPAGGGGGGGGAGATAGLQVERGDRVSDQTRPSWNEDVQLLAVRVGRCREPHRSSAGPGCRREP